MQVLCQIYNLTQIYSRPVNNVGKTTQNVQWLEQFLTLEIIGKTILSLCTLGRVGPPTSWPPELYTQVVPPSSLIPESDPPSWNKWDPPSWKPLV